MEFNLTTPSLLFPAISLLMLAFTNRFMTVANLVRELHSQYKDKPDDKILTQVKNLKLRLNLIRIMQAIGVASLLLCVVCMLALFKNYVFVAEILFAISLVLLTLSLALSIWEIQISNNALKVILNDLARKKKKKR
ncbi:MAG TPA: DUF2721 domain-containing protein [Spirochaetota bacterium]|nr:MAG: hypothetical protein BWX91_01355 [Spirochaetes bacterium ADurb.Bin133]HNZ26157.1 DUF2721 domain-containing protein [Spirochaetota bacterium]HPY87367.1 DUF2721 domain-containing protein [Spirochaetota bacterium]HQB62091.1 DUF2721 domain-containing protein [Spirochaetota bacterium]